MRKSTVIALIVVVIVIGGGVGAYLAVRSPGDKTTPTTTNNTSSDMANMDMSQKSTDTNATPVATNSVTIQNFAFSPSDITVKKGTTVTWTNNDSTAHTVTETDDSKGPDSGTLASGKSYSFTFDTVGTFHYHCTFHPQMVGTVTVTE